MKFSGPKSLVWGIVSPLTWPFVLLYAMVVRLKNAAYDLRMSKPRHLSWPVISIGNLSVGGTGKTPMVISLACLLRARGWNVDVLSRGYGRSSRQMGCVDPEGTPEMFGDEPLLIARRGPPVYVGADRYQAGLLAERDAATEPALALGLHILDDGFQHRQLSRAIDIVLLQRADLSDDMLPAGRLREPLCALERADICVLRAHDADLKDRVLQLMRQTDSGRVWIIDRRMTLPPQLSASRDVLAFCAIGDPRGFFDGLKRAGIRSKKEIPFRDHHAYTQKDIDRLKAAARHSGAQYFVTTEKDNVRLASHLRTDLEKEFPLIIAGLEICLRDEAGAMTTLESLLAESNAGLLQVQRRNVRS